MKRIYKLTGRIRINIIFVGINLRGVVALMKEKGYSMRPILINLNID
jgi:hypothetical protein